MRGFHFFASESGGERVNGPEANRFLLSVKI